MRLFVIIGLMFVVVVLFGCSGWTGAAIPEGTEAANSSPEIPDPAAAGSPDHSVPKINRRTGTDDDYSAINFLLPFDGIRPIYEPQFVSMVDAPLHDDELVMGAAIAGEAKAYPVTVLRFREMVNDDLGGTPILVSW